MQRNLLTAKLNCMKIICLHLSLTLYVRTGHTQLMQVLHIHSSFHVIRYLIFNLNENESRLTTPKQNIQNSKVMLFFSMINERNIQLRYSI